MHLQYKLCTGSECPRQICIDSHGPRRWVALALSCHVCFLHQTITAYMRPVGSSSAHRPLGDAFSLSMSAWSAARIKLHATSSTSWRQCNVANIARQWWLRGCGKHDSSETHPPPDEHCRKHLFTPIRAEHGPDRFASLDSATCSPI